MAQIMMSAYDDGGNVLNLNHRSNRKEWREICEVKSVSSVKSVKHRKMEDNIQVLA